MFFVSNNNELMASTIIILIRHPSENNYGKGRKEKEDFLEVLEDTIQLCKCKFPHAD